MDKQKIRKSKAAKSMKDLPVKTVNARTAKAVKGGTGLVFGNTEKEYVKQK